MIYLLGALAPALLVPASPPVRARVVRMSETDAKAAWLAKNLPTWSGAGKVSADSLAEGQAVPAWLSDGLGKVSTWSQAAGALRQAAAEFSALAEACGSGDDVACATLTREEASKRAWLERLDAPTWAKTASPAPLAALSEAEAKAAWLANAPSWGKAATALSSVWQAEATEVAALTDACGSGDEAACDTLTREEEAKRAWLSRLDTPNWGRAPEAAELAAAPAEPEAPPAASAAEAEAKAKWLASLDAPSWGKAAAEPAAPAGPAAEPAAPAAAAAAEEAEAKARWLASLDAPSWGKPRPAAAEAEAKAKWLASLDAPSWGTQAAAATAPSEPAAVQAEQAAAAAAEAEAAKVASLPSLSHTVHRPRVSLHAFREARRRG